MKHKMKIKVNDSLRSSRNFWFLDFFLSTFRKNLCRFYNYMVYLKKNVTAFNSGTADEGSNFKQ